MPSVSAPLSAAQKRRLSRMFRIPGSVRLGDLFDVALTENDAQNVIGRATNGTTSGLFVWLAPADCVIQSIKVIPEVDDAGGATTASHTWTFKKNNAGTAIASLASVATITAGTVTDAGAILAASAALLAGDRVTVDLIAGSTAAAMQRVIVVVTVKRNVISQIGSAT